MLLCLLALAAVSARAAPWYDNWNHHRDALIAHTSNGAILGHIAPNTSTVVEYLGIPYAEPPVGQLRFAAPQPYTGQGFYNASSFGLDCPQPSSRPSKYPNLTPQAQRIIDYFTGNAGTPQGEDCLTLNIWQPRGDERSRHLKAVIVFLHGGRFQGGTSDTPFYYGQFLAQSQDIVVVTLNFRSNIFGFPGVPGEKQNLGLRDQRVAVEWLQKNIAAFGGDPQQLILMGQSAGAVAVDYWSYAYLEEPIVSGLISHSGDVFSFPLNADGAVMKNWYNVSARLGCGSSGDTLACMRQLDYQAIQTAAAALPVAKSDSPLRGTSPLYPVVDNVTVFGDYKARSDAGRFARIPYLLGNNNFEQGWYQLTAYATGLNATKEQDDAFLLSSFTCPNYVEAVNRKKYNVPVWLFRYFGNWTNLELYPGSGAYHGSDCDVLFGNDAQVSGIDPSSAERQTTITMQTAWGAFAKDPVNGLSKLGYPSFDSTTESLIRFAYDQNPQASFVSPAVYAGSCTDDTLAAP